MKGYVVNKIQKGPEAPPAKQLESIRYPPNDIPGVVVSEISLWEVEKNVGGIFSWSYWRSYFNMMPDYNVILQQKNPEGANGDSVVMFVLHESADLEDSKGAFQRLKDTIEPLVDDCTLMLTKELLKEIVLPEPISPDNLSHHLTEVMESNPCAHPDWVKVLRSLMLTAIGKGNAEAVGKLLDRGVSVEDTDSGGNNLLHCAAASGSANVWKRMAGKLTRQKSRMLHTTINQEGKAPIHLAFEKNLPDIVMSMMKSGVVLSSVKNEDGSNPLHMAAEAGSEDSIAAAHHRKEDFLSNQSSDNPERQQFLDALNDKNMAGYTPLMVAVQKGYVGSAVTLLQAGADPDIQYSETGDTALHLAAKMGMAAIAKALIAFRANIEIKNNDGKTPLEEAEENCDEDNKECLQVLIETTELFEAAKVALSETVEPTPLSPDSTVLLSLDGGGCRGLLSCQILISIYVRMKQLQPDCAPIHKYFDYMAGTSAGGLLVLSMVYASADPRMSVATFFKAATELFSKCPDCPEEIVDSSMMETFGANQMLTSVVKPRVIVTACQANRNPPALELMCNYRPSSSNRLWKAWETGRATSAAPIYFPPFEGKYIDGGLMANNPTLDAMVEIVDQAEREGNDDKLKFGLVLSIGTGITPHTFVKDVRVHVPKLRNFFSTMAHIRESFSSLQSVLNLFISQSTQADGQAVHQARCWCKSMGCPYFRLSPPLVEAVDLAEDSKAKLAELMYVGLHYTHHNITKIDTIARLLLSRPPSQ